MKKAFLLLLAALLFASCSGMVDDVATPYEDVRASFTSSLNSESVETVASEAKGVIVAPQVADVVTVASKDAAVAASKAEDVVDVSVLPFGEKTYRGNVAVYPEMENGYFGLSYIGQSTLWNKADIIADGGYKVFETEDGKIYAVAFVSKIDNKLYAQINTGDVYLLCD